MRPGRRDQRDALEELGKNKYAIGIAALMNVKNYPAVKVLRISRHKGEPGSRSRRRMSATAAIR